MDEDGAFGTLIGELMRGVPKEKKGSLRLRIMHLVEEAKEQ